MAIVCIDASSSPDMGILCNKIMGTACVKF